MSLRMHPQLGMRVRRVISAQTTVIGCPRIKSYLSNTHIYNKSQSPESVLAYRAGLSSGGETPSMNGPVSMPESCKGHDSDTAKNLVTLAPSMALSNGFPANNGVRLGPNSLAPPNASSDVAWHLPQGSWETHVHVFDPRYLYSPERQYTPVSALYDELLDFNSNLSVTDLPGNIVLVQPSPYGSDNSLVLDLLRNHSLTQQSNLLRAIAVIDPENVTDEELHEMNALGVRGIRINTQAANSTETAEELRKNITAAVERVKGFNNWKCQLYISGDSWDYIHDLVRDLPIPVIADHQGGMGGLTKLVNGSTDVTAQPGFASLLDLAKSGKVFVKISALYRSSKLTVGGYDDLEPLIKVFAQEVPQQLIWGSDWPHTGSNRTEATRYVPEPFRKVDNEAVLKNIRKWVGHEVWRQMTVVTPGKTYI